MYAFTGRIHRLIALLGLLALMAVPSAAAGQQRAALGGAAPLDGEVGLAELLNADGSLRTDTGFSGSLSAHGWTMSTAAGGAPRFTPAPQAAGDEQWDDRFGATGFNNTVTAIAVTAAGGIYVGGEFDRVGDVAASGIAYWDGERWHALGAGLYKEPTRIVLGNTRVYVIGSDLFQTSDVKIAQWDGSAWSAVGSGGSGINSIYAAAVSGNDLYVGGFFGSIDGVAANSIARWDGSAWHPLGAGVSDYDALFGSHPAMIYDIAISGSTIYVGGDFNRAGGQAIASVARWDGSAWHAMGAGVMRGTSVGSVKTIAVSGSNVYVGGTFDQAGGQAAASVARWDGASWHALGAGLAVDYGLAEATDLTVSGDNLYVAGDFARAGGQQIANLAHWDGASWHAIGGEGGIEGFAPIGALALTPEGGLLAGGSFTRTNDAYVGHLGLWDGAGWQALGPGGVHDEINMADDVYAIAIDAAGNVYVGGTFTYAGGVLANNIAMWDGSRWSSLASGSNDKVYALAVAGGSLYAAGAFTQIGAISANHIAKWNPGTKAWSALGSGINNTVYTLAYADGLLYAGGNFTAAGSALANDVAYWDGAQWHAFGDTFQIYQVNQRGAENDTTVYALAIAGSDVYVGGQFWTLQDRASSGYVEVNNIVVWDRSSDEWSFVGTPTATVKAGVVDTESAYAATVNALALSGDQLYVGGIFNQAGSLATSGLARWNIAGNTWADVGGVGGFSYPYLSEVKALTPFGGYLYVGGKFTSAGTASARFVARMDLASGAWSALGSGIGDTHGYDEYTYVYSIAASGEGIYLGGNFSSVATQPSYGLARWGAPGVSGSMGAAGGTLSGVDGTSLTFPAGAVPNSITVSYTALFAPAHQPPAGQAIIRSFTLRATGADGGPVTTFAKPYTLRVPYTDAQLAALGISDPTKLNVAYWGGSAWANMLPCAGCRVDTAGKAVVVVANHFSEFALAGSRTYVYLPLVRR